MLNERNNPYVGLRPFDTDESILFFGRSEQTLELLERLHKFHFVAVVGTSGCGKSSLLRAGLIPSLKAGFLVNDSNNWTIAIMKPGDRPMHNLVESIFAGLQTKAPQEVIRNTVNKVAEEGTDALIDLLEPVWQQQRNNFFLLVDQFEEVFRFAMETNDVRKKDEAIEFVTTILELSKQRRVPVYVVITMRSDFIGDCTQFFGLAEALNESQYLVPRIGRNQMKAAIEGPARLFGAKLHPSLTSNLLNEMAKVKDELPLVQHALMRMWDYAIVDGRRDEINNNDYAQIGGLENALSLHADEAMLKMDEGDKGITKIIFQALTAVDNHGRKIRRPVMMSHLMELTGQSKEKLNNIIRRFIEDGRSFIVINEAADGKDVLLDISHESLIREWDKLSNWVNEENESVSVYLQLSESARLHKIQKKDLLTGSELQGTKEWVDKYKPVAIWANRYKEGFEEYIEYFNQSIKAEDLRKEEEILKQKADARQKRRTRLLAIGIVVAVFLFGIYAFYQYLNTNKLKSQADNQYKAMLLHAIALEKLETNPSEAFRFEGEALKLLDSPIIEQTATRIFLANPLSKQLFSSKIVFPEYASFSPDFKKVAMTGPGTDVLVFDLKGNLLHHFNNGNKENKDEYHAYFSPVWSTDGRLILAASTDSSALLWDSSGKLTRTFPDHNGYLMSVAHSADGKKIVIVSSDNTAKILDLQGRNIGILKGHDGNLTKAVFSPDGHYIAGVSDDKSIIFWDSSGRMVRRIYGHHEKINDVAFSNDSKWLVTGSDDSTALVINVEATKAYPFCNSGSVSSVCFSPDGKCILTTSSDKVTRVWGLLSIFYQYNDDRKKIKICEGSKKIDFYSENINFKPLEILRGINEETVTAKFSPDGNLIFTVSRNGDVKVWNHKQPIITDVDLPERVSTMYKSINGTFILENDSANRLLFLNDDLKATKIVGLLPRKQLLATAPGGDKYFYSDTNNSSFIYDRITEKLTEVKIDSSSIRSATFSRDGKNIIVKYGFNNGALLDLDGHILHRYHANMNYFMDQFEFSPKGDYILCYGQSHTSTIMIGKISSDSLLCKRMDGRMQWARFTPDGNRILVNCKGIVLLDLDGNIISRFISDWGSVDDGDISPDGKMVVVHSGHAISLFDMKGRRLWNFMGFAPEEYLLKAKFSADGKKLISLIRTKETAKLVTIKLPQSVKDYIKSDMFVPLTEKELLDNKIK